MADVDPETLLEWLNMGQGDERDMQLIALEQLCMLLLMSDNVDRCFESCPPRTFLPALCRIFLDECAPDNVLEVTARAITYYLDVSAECTRRIVAVDGAIKAICNRLVVADVSSRANLTWSVLGNPLGSDHFPVVISYATPIACATLCQPWWKFDQADWETFRTQADITEDMVSSGSIDEAVSLVTSCILSAANNAILQPSSRLPRFPKPWWNKECQMVKKDKNKAWNRFRRYPTPDNMIAFNKARGKSTGNVKGNRG
ncbi:e3 ubiquitin-protein ligase Ufd4 [Trichonephila clavata]|uniref:E3 ubiquitin-protein ligase n=1 Tax=Trichonephila clavata TaxID=2740835 RepID=A0A8X6LKC0_TRICU|nr:e3 ubiquitin-protein ligase Ufd4 [Trichonephila clavata]